MKMVGMIISIGFLICSIVYISVLYLGHINAKNNKDKITNYSYVFIYFILAIFATNYIGISSILSIFFYMLLSLNLIIKIVPVLDGKMKISQFLNNIKSESIILALFTLALFIDKLFLQRLIDTICK